MPESRERDPIADAMNGTGGLAPKGPPESFDTETTKPKAGSGQKRKKKAAKRKRVASEPASTPTPVEDVPVTVSESPKPQAKGEEDTESDVTEVQPATGMPLNILVGKESFLLHPEAKLGKPDVFCVEVAVPENGGLKDVALSVVGSSMDLDGLPLMVITDDIQDKPRVEIFPFAPQRFKLMQWVRADCLVLHGRDNDGRSRNVNIAVPEDGLRLILKASAMNNGSDPVFLDITVSDEEGMKIVAT
jgi:hypothetical protein